MWFYTLNTFCTGN